METFAKVSCFSDHSNLRDTEEIPSISSEVYKQKSKDLNVNSKCYHISFIFILFFYLGSNILLFYCIAIKLCNLNCASLKMHKSQYELKYFSSLFHQFCWLPWMQCILFSTNWQPRMLKSYWVNWQWAESHKTNKNSSGGPLSALTCCVNARLLSGDKKNIAVNLFSKLGWELGLYYASYDDFHPDILARMYT